MPSPTSVHSSLSSLCFSPQRKRNDLNLLKLKLQEIPSIISDVYRPTLPPELTDRILDHLHDDFHALAACSLTCRAWLPSCRYHKFSAVRTRSSAKKLYELLCASPEIGLYVRRLEVDPLSPHSIPGDILARITRKLPNVTILLLEFMAIAPEVCFDAVQFSPATVASNLLDPPDTALNVPVCDIPAISLRKITTQFIRGVTVKIIIDSLIASCMVSHVEHLCLSNISPHDITTWDRLVQAACLSLKKISISLYESSQLVFAGPNLATCAELRSLRLRASRMQTFCAILSQFTKPQIEYTQSSEWQCVLGILRSHAFSSLKRITWKTGHNEKFANTVRTRNERWCRTSRRSECVHVLRTPLVLFAFSLPFPLFAFIPA
ncbi:hypothetical protein A0H81_05459 [Grifola frondosa]|uniref:F-box domain-containing protein n=1 Tax=Grifola frondosa TaxID=5627 RepID=A0A1C7MD46_GRIFR|nr:hypothetical protein A0H81_05459 [Grifola frondosa]